MADSFVTEVRARYAGTRLGRQELDGILVDGVDGALWQEPALVGAQINGEPDCDRIKGHIKHQAKCAGTSTTSAWSERDSHVIIGSIKQCFNASDVKWC